MKKKVFVTSCFDMLHSGHVAFLQGASQFGDLHVNIGSDEKVFSLEGIYPVNPQEERLYMIKSLSYVDSCRISKGMGIINFVEDLEKIKPNVFEMRMGIHQKKKRFAENAVLNIKYWTENRLEASLKDQLLH